MNYKELLEFQKFRDFLPTKNGIKTFELRGHDNLEGDNMRIVIEASPGRLASITYYDGIGNQIYPPHTLAINEIINYINNISDEHDIYEIVIAGPKNYTTKIAENLKQVFKNTNFTLLV